MYQLRYGITFSQISRGANRAHRHKTPGKHYHRYFFRCGMTMIISGFGGVEDRRRCFTPWSIVRLVLVGYGYGGLIFSHQQNSPSSKCLKSKDKCPINSFLFKIDDFKSFFTLLWQQIAQIQDFLTDYFCILPIADWSITCVYPSRSTFRLGLQRIIFFKIILAITKPAVQRISISVKYFKSYSNFKFWHLPPFLLLDGEKNDKMQKKLFSLTSTMIFNMLKDSLKYYVLR